MVAPLTSPVGQSVAVKVVIIGILTFLLLIPLTMLWALTFERSSRRDDVSREVGAVWGGRQTIGGFALSVPFDTVSETKGEVVRAAHRAVVLPQSLTIDAGLTTEVRRRSIFPVTLYQTRVVATGTFVPPDFSKLGVTPDVVHWSNAVFDTGIADLRGVVSVTVLSWNGQPLSLEPSGGDGPFGGGLRAIAPISASAAVPFRLEMVVAGSQGLMFVPSGAQTDVTMQSTWPSPSFTGSLLPASHETDPDGFNAVWRSNFLSRPFPQSWIEGSIAASTLADKFRAAAFGVNLVTTVDHYQQTERAMKYGVLFIVLTFAVFFAWEIIERLRVHPIQYLLVGFALLVFYLLLLSLGEHIPFGGAYVVASAATVLLVSGYAASILRAGRRGLVVGAAVSTLYGLLFVLLRLEDLALLVGAVVVFLVLAAVMYATRRVDWYGGRSDTTGQA